MNKKYLLKRLKSLKGMLRTAQQRAEDPATTEETLIEIETQVEEITAEINEVNDMIESLPDDESTEVVDVVEDLGAAVEEVEDAVDENITEEEVVEEPTQARSRVLGIIGKGLESRGEQKLGKLNKRSAFLRYLSGRLNQSQARSLGIKFNNGKVLVPTELSKEIISYVQEENPLRAAATPHKTKGMQGFPVQVKKADANIVEEERDDSNLIPFTDLEFDDVYLDPKEFDAIIKVTKKLTHMSDFDIEAIVLDELKSAYLRKEAFWHFSAPTNPGSLAKKAVEFVVAEGTVNKYLKLIQLKNALPTSMRAKARWMINRQAQTELESILDNNGNPILKDSGNEEFSHTLFTFPVIVTDYADEWNVSGSKYDPSKPMIYFGDFSYFHIQDVLGTLEIEPLRELIARENKVGFKIYHISDGQLIYGPFETPVYFLDILADGAVGG
ncbi:phage major capsid protein [Jeotgalibaca porci]|uniref:phage major capsid protein n=1 Tax=Jeotgalibaca porci TaxID=1868793 RepID=UPI0035A0FD28